MPSHTIKRGSVYYFRRRIPLDLVEAHEGQREVYYSLGTKNKADAERKARRESVILDEKWAALRAGRPKRMLPDTIPTDWDLVEVAGKVIPVPPPRGGWPDTELLNDTQAEYEQAKYEHEQEAADAERDEERALSEADRVLAALRLRGVHLSPASPAPSPERAQAVASGPQAKRETLDDVIEAWERDRKPNSKTVAKYKVAALEFNLLHRDPPVASITRRMVIAYRDKVQKDGKTVSTVNGRMSALRALLGVAKDRGILESNPADEAALPPDKRAVDAKLPYSPDQAATVLKATECLKDTRPDRYWLPRLAKWTGARLNELHQLRKWDLIERDGIRGILITDEGECLRGLPMRLKNGASRRWLPLHSELDAFWTWATSSDDGALFPAKPNVHDIISDNFSKWYGRQRRAWGIEDKRVTFHSWRHMFSDKCRAAGVSAEVRKALMGHAEGGAAGMYGCGELPPKVLAAAIAKLA